MIKRIAAKFINCQTVDGIFLFNRMLTRRRKQACDGHLIFTIQPLIKEMLSRELIAAVEIDPESDSRSIFHLLTASSIPVVIHEELIFQDLDGYRLIYEVT